MQITIKVNIGNYESVDFTTNEYEDSLDCYWELRHFLRDWKDLGGKRQAELIDKIIAKLEEKK